MRADLSRKAAFVAGLALFLLAVATAAYYILGPAEGYFHSDSTDTIFWAEASLRSGRIFDPTFDYAAMLPFGGELLMLVWMPFFGTSMTTQALGMLSFLVVLAAALLFLFRSWKFRWGEALFWSGVVLLVFSASDKLREMFWGHVIYYSLYVVFTCVGFGLFARLVDGDGTPSRKNLLLLGGLGLFAFLVALDGLQVILIWTCPLLASLFLVRYLRLDVPLLARKNYGFLAVLGVVAVGTVLGYAILLAIRDGQIAGYANAWYGVTPMDEWLDHLFNIPEHWITLLGGGVPDGGMTKLEIAEMLGSLGVALLLAAFPFVAPFVARKSKNETYRAFTIQHFILSALILLGVVFGSLGAANWRWIPVVASALFLLVFTLRTLAVELQGIRFTFLLAPVLFAFALLNAREILTMPADYGRDNQLHELVATLEAEGLTYGYGDFWIAQAATVLSDGAVAIRSINVSDDGIDPYSYQSSRTWYEDQEGVDRYFLVLTNWDYTQLRLSDDYGTISSLRVEEITWNGYVIVVLSGNPF